MAFGAGLRARRAVVGGTTSPALERATAAMARGEVPLVRPRDSGLVALAARRLPPHPGRGPRRDQRGVFLLRDSTHSRVRHARAPGGRAPETLASPSNLPFLAGDVRVALGTRMGLYGPLYDCSILSYGS